MKINLNINLEEEIHFIQKELTKIDIEYKSYYNNLFVHEIENVSFNKNKDRAGLYFYYPYLFYDYFKEVNIKVIRKIAISGVLYLKSVLLNDDFIDSNNFPNPTNLFHSNFLYGKCIKGTSKN